MGRGQAGVMLLRACPLVAEHMLWLVRTKPELRFPYHDAEQDFFDWCGPLAHLRPTLGYHPASA